VVAAAACKIFSSRRLALPSVILEVCRRIKSIGVLPINLNIRVTCLISIVERGLRRSYWAVTS
jgi:hypothetical protein